MDNENMLLKGDGYSIKIIVSDRGYEYEIWQDDGLCPILMGDGYTTYEALIGDLSEFHVALRAIFG